MQIEFKIPDKNTPGYLRRLRMALKFQAGITNVGIAPDLINEIADFLVDFITIPANRTEAKLAIEDASEAQFFAMLSALTGGSNDKDPLLSTAPPPLDDTSRALDPLPTT